MLSISEGVNIKDEIKDKPGVRAAGGGGEGMKFDQAKILIDYINDEDYEPNEWECEFIDSLLKRKTDLSEKQYACLQKIYEKATR